jgi:hypothetical protein
MRKLIAAAALVATTLGGVAAAAPMGSASPAQSRDMCGEDGSNRNPEVVGLTDAGKLVCFRASRPGRATEIGTVRGLQVDTRLVGIDFRPATGDLYGFGDKGGVYTLDVTSGQATLASRTSVTLRGVSFGVDFNPAADRLRITSDAGQNLRINVADGTTNTDGDLNYTAGTPATGIGGSAYTNNDADANTGTTLFDVDSALDQVAIQSPPNNGSLVLTGKLGTDTVAELGADIYSKVRNGTTVENTAYAALNVRGGSTFYAVDLLTGRAYDLGDISARRGSIGSVVGIAIPLVQG